jgi:DNA (cytosine-5)-methyltransferase 1
LKQYFALTERRSEEAKKLRKEYRNKYGKDFSPRRAKVLVPRTDMMANCIIASNGIEQYLLEVITEEDSVLEDRIPMTKKKPIKRKPFKYVSLFAGIGGFELGLNDLGGECVLASEYDPVRKMQYNQIAYEAIHGYKPEGDVTKIKSEDVPEHDVMVGGFPCQAFSIAGKRGGFDDARGTLFFEMARIAAEQRNKPKVIWGENVKGLISHDKGKTLDTIIMTLNEIGYTVDFTVRNSKFFDVPQNRERIFIMAVRDDLIEKEDWITNGKGVLNKAKERIMKYPDSKTFNFDWPEEKEVTKRLVDILEPEVDEKYYLSEEKTAKLVAELKHMDFSQKSDDIVTAGRINKEGFRQTNEVLGTNGVSTTIRTFQGGGLQPKIAEQVDGLPIREATKQGYTIAQEGDSVNYKFPDSKTRRGRVGRQMSQTLETDIKVGVVVADHIRYRIRKLTPLECFRLQGFPDEVYQKVADAGISQSQQYKMIGNAVTVNVIRAIGEKLLPILNQEPEKPKKAQAPRFEQTSIFDFM